MQYNEDRDSLKDVPTFTLPPPPRFDAAASAAARPVEPLAEKRILSSLWLSPKFSRLFNRRSKLLALMAIVGLASGAAGGMLVVQRDKQQRIVNSSSMIPIPAEQPGTVEAAPSPVENKDVSLEASPPIENQVRARPSHRRVRGDVTSKMAVLSNADDEDELDQDKDDADDKDDNKDKDKNDDARKKNRGDRNRAVLYDVLRSRKP